MCVFIPECLLTIKRITITANYVQAHLLYCTSSSQISLIKMQACVLLINVHKTGRAGQGTSLCNGCVMLEGLSRAPA